MKETFVSVKARKERNKEERKILFILMTRLLVLGYIG
jgi:hypothetical protein